MLTASTMLAPHFSAGELTRDGGELGAFIPDVTPTVAANLQTLATVLESVRGSLGVPLRITSGFRPPAKNSAVAGASGSSHLDGLAADFVPVGLSQYAAYRALQSSPAPAWDQIIYYPVQGHIHLGLGSRMRREVRIALSSDPGGTPLLSESLIDRLAGYAASSVDVARDHWRTLGLFVLLLGAVFLFRRSSKGN